MENRIKKFISNKKKNNSYLISKKILKNVINLSNTQSSNLILKNFSNIFDIPEEVLKLKYNKLVYNTFSYDKLRFNNKILIINIFKELLKSIIIFLKFIFAKNNEKIDYYDFIIHGIDDSRSYERYDELIKKFRTSLIISNNKILTKNKKVSIYKDSKYQAINQEAIKGKKLKIISLFFQIFLQSIISNFNYIYFYNLILFSIIKNYSIFYNNRGKYFMEDRFYNTCSIRNYFFKKFGGLATSTPQKNIVETCISYFVDTDIFFSLANEKFSIKRLREFGGRVDVSVPVGSFFLEHDWYRKKKDLTKVPKNEILIMGLNPNTWLKMNDLNYKNYEYVCREWIRNISKMYPKINIMIKHHSNLKDNIYEKKFFKNTNVISLIDDNSNNRSYGYIDRSDITFSFASTTILEGISMGKQCYFIDPGFGAKNFFYKLNNLNKIRIGSFNKFKKIIKNKLSKKKVNKIYKKNMYCLKSNKVSLRVYNYYTRINYD